MELLGTAAVLTAQGLMVAVGLLRRRQLARWRRYFEPRVGYAVRTGSTAFHAQYRTGGVTAVAVTVRLNSGGGGAATLAVTPSPLALTTLYITRQNELHRAWRLVGQQDVQVGHREFDDNFLIQGDVPSVVRGVLGQPAMRAAVLKLFWHLSGSASIHVDESQIRISTPVAGPELADALVRASLDFHHALVAHANCAPVSAPVHTAPSVPAASGSPTAVPPARR